MKKKAAKETPTPKTPEDFCVAIADIASKRRSQLRIARDATDEAIRLDTEEMMLRMQFETYIRELEKARLLKERGEL